MKILIIILLSICFAFSSVSAFEGYGFIEAKDYNIKGVSIGDSYKEVIQKIGNPIKEERITSPFAEGKPIYLYYKGMKIFISDNEVMNIKITEPNLKVKGIGVGDNTKKVLATFGEAKLQKCSSKCLKYILKTENGTLTDAQLIFLLESDNVKSIIFWFDFT